MMYGWQQCIEMRRVRNNYVFCMYMICMHLYVFVASWYIVIHCTCIMHRCLVAKWSLYVMIMGLSLNNPSFFTTIHFYPEEKIAVLPFESFWHIPTKHQIQFTQVNISKYWRVVPVTKHSLRHSRECSGRALAMDKQLFAGTIHLGAIRIAAGGGSWMAMTAWSGKHEGHQHHVPVLLHLLPTERHYFPRSSWCSCSIYFHLNLTSYMMDYHPWGSPWFIRTFCYCDLHWSSFWIGPWTKCSSTLAMLCDTSCPKLAAQAVQLCPWHQTPPISPCQLGIGNPRFIQGSERQQFTITYPGIHMCIYVYWNPASWTT